MRLLLAIVALHSVVAIAKTPVPLSEQIRSLIGVQLNSSLPIVARINEVDEDGLNALHHAAILGDLPLVKFLLANGANPIVKDQYRRYALDYVVAIAEKDLSCQQKLIAFTSDRSDLWCLVSTERIIFSVGMVVITRP